MGSCIGAKDSLPRYRSGIRIANPAFVRAMCPFAVRNDGQCPGIHAPTRRADARLFRRQARRKYRASMRQKINLAELYADALAGLPDRMDGAPPLPVPQACPVTLDELLAQPVA
jgi:hypothetical protein